MTDEPTNLADHAAKKGNPWFGLGNLLSSSQGDEQSKHDGNLGGDTCVLFDMNQVAIIGYFRGITLTPKQALSLLSWLEQEKPALEKMVGVEKDTPKG